MFKNYQVYYWNDKMQKVGIPVSAQSALDAKMYAESQPGFKCLVDYPKEVK